VPARGSQGSDQDDRGNHAEEERDVDGRPMRAPGGVDQYHGEDDQEDGRGGQEQEELRSQARTLSSR